MLDFAGLMKAAAKSKVMASVTRLDRNNTDASSDGEPTSDFDTADEDEGKEPCRGNTLFRDADFLIFSVFSVIFGLIRKTPVC